MFNLFYKSWIWYRLGVIIVFIYVRLAFSFFYLLTLLICVRFSSTAPCTSAWAPHFCSLGPKRKTREIPKGGIFFFLFFLIFPFSTSPFIRTDTSSTAPQKPSQSPRQKKHHCTVSVSQGTGLTEVGEGGGQSINNTRNAGRLRAACSRVRTHVSLIY